MTQTTVFIQELKPTKTLVASRFQPYSYQLLLLAQLYLGF
ncbi:hypothetical protein AVDCRST_MAG92-3745 [uncultured Coleofasciculus sp.]|uniref:Uncharacterized protein n=1 Tax=uncultured Coleofasciculus sp. TaxID=1267456 RepID=A0A6J4JPN3_9CYAN|nr:hypothetical protein AVDCRST_MAG92-3745 [uncultured Coleofasciculus sp.]